jgi:hypothetical protein
MPKYTTHTDNDLVDQLMHQFAEKCNYLLTHGLSTQLKPFAKKAAEVCKLMKIDPATYIDAQLMYETPYRGQPGLIPAQLCGKDAKIHVTSFISLGGDRHIDREFETECRMLSQCLDSGWSERLALLNSTFDFSPWFRILIASERDEELITQYGRMASQILNNDMDLVKYLKSIKSKEGYGFDFSRIPDFKA